MAHFARINRDNVVEKVHVVNDAVITDKDGKEQEQLGIDFLIKLWGYAWYKQTSYNRTFRKRFANKGSTYDVARDIFIDGQPYPSWTLNDTTTEWEPPTAMPTDKTKFYVWNEVYLRWDTIS